MLIERQNYAVLLNRKMNCIERNPSADNINKNKFMTQKEVGLGFLKLRNGRPNVFTQDEFNQSDDDRKSFYSEMRHKPSYNFQQRNEYYEDQPTKTRGKSGFIVSPSKHMAETIGFTRPTKFAMHNLSEQIKVKKEFEELASIDGPVYPKRKSFDSNRVDYDRLYRQIKLTPMLQEKNESQYTLEPPSIDPKSYSMSNQPWSHVSDHLSQLSRAPMSDDPTQILQKQQQFYFKPVGRITQRTFVPHVQISEPKKMVDEQNQTNFQQLDKDFDEDHQQSCKDEQVQTNFAKVAERLEIKDEQVQTNFVQAENHLRRRQQENHFTLQVHPQNPLDRQPQKPKYDNIKPEIIQNKEEFERTEHDNQQQLGSKNYQSQVNIEKASDRALEPQFDLNVFLQVYYSLRSIQANIRNPNLIKSIKSYLQLIATGKIDNFEYVRVPLHKKKTLKLSLLYERISIIVIAFSYASGTIGESHRYLSNLVRYAINNYLIALKIMTNEHNKEYPNLTKEHKEVWALCNKDQPNKCFELLKDNNQILLQTIFKLSKYDSLFYQNLKKFVKNSSKFTIQQTFYFVLQYFAFFLNLCEMQAKIPFLAVAPNPYLPPPETHKYTLVVDLIQVMCHPKKTDSFRPYSQYFLDEMSQYYEIVAFSVTFPNQVSKLIEFIDRKKRIQHKLYKHHAIKSSGHYLKDTSRLGRDLTKVILVDTVNSQRSTENTICVKAWNGGTKDTVLAELCPILAMIALKEMDARDAVNKYRDQSLQNQKSGVKYINYGMNL